MSKQDSVRARAGADPFSRATTCAQHLTEQLVQDGIPPAIIADAMLVQGLSAWAAETGRKTAASELLRVWTSVRDS